MKVMAVIGKSLADKFCTATTVNKKVAIIDTNFFIVLICF